MLTTKATTTLLFLSSLALNAILYFKMSPPRRSISASSGPGELPLASPHTHTALEFDLGAHHYNITDAGSWTSLVPAYGGHIWLRPNAGSPARSGENEYAVGLFSDLRCLDVIRAAFVSLRDASGPSVISAEQEVDVDGCLGQIRQAIRCASDITIEPTVLECDEQLGICDSGASGDHVVHQCRDWVQVRQFVERHQRR
ncbi:unnamed protein product [Mycena citricolor]|uniref:Uncharacterized protein n=1 Tax=Mycena citricolor TaxID=2018698 RepID=A0AAD2I0F8_9AGAR|nr:unnamed protein product [Mycena citricolor]